MTELQETVILDVLGEICPIPMLKAVDAMKAAKPGATIEVITDHTPALMTIPNSAIKLGWDVNIQRTKSTEWKIVLTHSPIEKEA